MKVFEFENNSGTRLNQMTRPDQDISQINIDSQYIGPQSALGTNIFSVQATPVPQEGAGKPSRSTLP